MKNNRGEEEVSKSLGIWRPIQYHENDCMFRNDCLFFDFIYFFEIYREIK